MSWAYKNTLHFTNILIVSSLHLIWSVFAPRHSATHTDMETSKVGVLMCMEHKMPFAIFCLCSMSNQVELRLWRKSESMKHFFFHSPLRQLLPNWQISSAKRHTSCKCVCVGRELWSVEWGFLFLLHLPFLVVPGHPHEHKLFAAFTSNIPNESMVSHGRRKSKEWIWRKAAWLLQPRASPSISNKSNKRKVHHTLTASTRM